MNMMMKTMMKIPLQYHLPAHCWVEAVCPLDPVVDLSAGSLSSQVVHWSLVDIGCLGFNIRENFDTNECPNIFIQIF